MDDVKALGRFPGFKAADLTAEQSEILQTLVEGRGGIPAPYRFLISSPLVARDLGALGTDLRKKGELTPREAEIVILVTAEHFQSPFVQWAHRNIGKSVGLSDAVIDAILARRVPDLPDARERAFYELAAALHHNPVVPEEAAKRAQEKLGNKAIAEVIAFIASYAGAAYTMRFVDARPPS